MKIRFVAIFLSLVEILFGLIHVIFLLFLIAGEFINMDTIIYILHLPLSEQELIMIGVVDLIILVYLDEYREKLFGEKSFWWWIRK